MSSDLFGKDTAAVFNIDSGRTVESNNGGTHKACSRILGCLPNSKLKGFVVVGKFVILVGSLDWIGLEIMVGATALTVLRIGGAGTTAGERDGRLPAPHSYASSHHRNKGSNAAEDGTWSAFRTQSALHLPRRCQDKQ